MNVGLGVVLQPDAQTLATMMPIIAEDVDYFEIAPETTWREQSDGALVTNGFWRTFAELGQQYARPFVAHGVGLSLGSAGAHDTSRQRRWLDRIAKDNATFQFLWYTDHLGVSAPTGLDLALPLPLPMTNEAALVVRGRLNELQEIVPDVGVENTAAYFTLGDPLGEPAFLGSIVAASRMHLLLDLHNVVTMAQNLGFDARRYIERLPLDRVIEIHVAGGRSSDPAWLPSKRALRLDGHDDAVPELVWSLLDECLPQTPNLRGVTLERMEATVDAGNVDALRDEVSRIRAALKRHAR